MNESDIEKIRGLLKETDVEVEIKDSVGKNYAVVTVHSNAVGSKDMRRINRSAYEVALTSFYLDQLYIKRKF